MTAALLAAVIGVVALATGFLAGLWAYAHVHGHFMARAEEIARKRAAAALTAERASRQKVDEIRRRAREMYGDDLSEKHQAVVDEEVERVLSGGPR